MSENNSPSVQLNAMQKQAAELLSGPILVLAGAGAGKTKTLTTRIVNLVKAGSMPYNILAITFTNKAAAEMKEKINTELKATPGFTFPVAEAGFLPWVGTFHALGVYILREQYAKVGISKYFAIYDSGDSRRTVKEAVKSLGLDPKQWDTKKVLGVISKNKSNFVTHAIFEKGSGGNYFSEEISKIWAEYERIKKNDKALDFDDLLLETALLLENDKEVRQHYQKRWQHVHIDEYQDTNKVQYTIVKHLVSEQTKNIFVVGDPDQNIYSWRGADISNIMSFEKDFSGGKTVLLEQNYRSTKTIIEASNAVIEKNTNRFEKTLFTENEKGGQVILHAAYRAQDEARWIAEKIKKYQSGDNEEGTKYEFQEMAVLYRANFQSRLLEEAMIAASIPYQVLGTKFFDRSEVKDVMSYVKAALNPESLIDVKRTINMPRRGLGKVALLHIFAGEHDKLSPKAQLAVKSYQKALVEIKEAISTISPSELVRFIIEVSGLEAMYKESKKEEDLERLANMYELAEVARKYDVLPQGEGVDKFIEDVALAGDQDSKKNTNTVKLMTIHASKGLEFEIIFVSGCEEALFTGRGEIEKAKQEAKQEEERRLFYVAMTRAKSMLFLSWANMRDVYGSTEVNLLCDFVVDIPPSLIFQEEAEFGYKGSNGDGNFSTDLLDIDF